MSIKDGFKLGVGMTLASAILKTAADFVVTWANKKGYYDEGGVIDKYFHAAAVTGRSWKKK